MQKTFQLEKEKINFMPVLYVFYGILIGISSHIYVVVFSMLAFTLINKEFKTYGAFTLSILMSNYLSGSDEWIMYAIQAGFVYACVKGIKHFDFSMIYLCACNTVLIIIMSMIRGDDLALSFMLSIGYALLSISMIDSQQTVNNNIIICCLLYFLGVAYYPDFEYLLSVVLLSVFVFQSSIHIYFVLIFYFYFQAVSPVLLLYALFMNQQKSDYFLYALGSLALLVVEIRYEFLVFSFIVMLFALFMGNEESSVSQKTLNLEKSHQLLLQQNFYKQLMNFSHIFHDLGKYYEYKFKVEGELLMLMSDALSYNAKVCKQYIYVKENRKQRIMEAIKGYKFNLNECEYEEDGNKIRVTLYVDQVYDEEIEYVIQPLIEKICECKMKIKTPKTRLFKGHNKFIVLESFAYINVDIYKNEIAYASVNGDQSSYFKMDNQSFCMLSDGMGKGANAHQISQLMVQIVEKLLRSDIPQVECAKLMNQFIHSDLYATLDILSFDQKNSVAYLSKSASAPTYLYRNEQLHEMGASSLPIGIVEHVSANVYEIPCFKDDVFIMVSDGVSKEEVKRWYHTDRSHSIKNEGINFMNILKQSKRSDDATIIMAKIS